MGLGSLVDKHAHTVDGVPYLDFLAPGLLAATAMQIGANESMYPVMGAIKWIRTYFAMLATPAAGRSTCSSATWPGSPSGCSSSSTIYLAVIAAFGVVHSPLRPPGPPGAVLTGTGLRRPHRRLRRHPGRTTSASPPSTASA